MTAIRREFLEDDNTRINASGVGLHEDYALVIGVNDYPDLRSLRGAIADAEAFAAWLVNTRGGALRAENIRTITSTGNPLGPIGPEINDALEDIFQRASQSGGRRFYFYFSGHGCVGDRANDLALCLAHWSSLRRRAALSVEAWLDVAVRSGVFDEVVFFLDCCRVWATRAVGLPPYIDFTKPVERVRGTRVFLAYATEFQRAASEVYGQHGETRGIFTRVLIDGLEGLARASNETITAASLKKYIEKATEQKAREFGLHQRAEVVNGLGEESMFGSPPRNGDVFGVNQANGSVTPAHDGIPEDPVFIAWLAAYRHFTESGQLKVRRARDEDRGAPSRLLLVMLAAANELKGQYARGRCDWSVLRGEGTTRFQLDNVYSDEPYAFSARLNVGPHVLRNEYPYRDREIAVQLFPGWTTVIALADPVVPRYETMRVFLIPGTSEGLPDASQLDYEVARYQYLLHSKAFDSTIAEYAVQLLDPISNPMHGLIAAHFLARQLQPDAARIASIADQVESMIGPCVDVSALRLRAALLGAGEFRNLPSVAPPMLREGLMAFLEASYKLPGLIAPKSRLEYACIERLVDAPISSWLVQREYSEIDDWVALQIEDMIASHGGDAATLDAATIARTLGIPKNAATTRIELTRQRMTRERAISISSESVETMADETMPIRAHTPMAVHADLIPGYQIGEMIGKGGVCDVYLAEHVATKARIALKLLPQEGGLDKTVRRRFLREIDTLTILKHDRIVGLTDHGEANGFFYFAMPHFERGSVADLVHNRGRPKLKNAIRIIFDVLSGMSYAHQRGYVHRDIKPQNLLVDNDDNIVIADFGLAKCIREADIWYASKPATVMGTPAFMAREQVENFREVRPSTDVWAIAAVFYWLLCGMIPRDVPGGRRDAFFEVRRNPIVSIRRRLPSLPDPLSALLDNALSDDPDQRPENAEAFREKLEQVMRLISGTAI